MCKLFQQDQVVCPPKLQNNLFTTAAVDNIDHNPSSTTTTDSYHGTGISLFQHSVAYNEGVSRDIVAIETTTTSKAIDSVPQSFSTIPVKTTTTTILGANHDVAHKALTSTLRYDSGKRLSRRHIRYNLYAYIVE